MRDQGNNLRDRHSIFPLFKESKECKVSKVNTRRMKSSSKRRPLLLFPIPETDSLILIARVAKQQTGHWDTGFQVSGSNEYARRGRTGNDPEEGDERRELPFAI